MANPNLITRNPRFIDLTGQQFGLWTVLSEVHCSGPAKWLCRCRCGRERRVNGACLRGGKSKSCGCGHSTTHGMTKSPEHVAWINMRDRCSNPHHKSYPRYAAEGS